MNEIMGDAPAEPIERRLILPTLSALSIGDLKYISGKIEEYATEVRAMIDTKAQERIAELKASIAAGQAELAALQPQPTPTKMANPSTPKYRDPEKPENTWAGRGKMPTWLKEKIDAGASLDDFLIDRPDTGPVPATDVDPEAGF